MVEPEEAAAEFFITYQELAKTVAPAVRDFNDPPAGAWAGLLSPFLGFLAPSFDMRDVAMLFDGAKRRGAGIACVGTQVLAAPLEWTGTLDHDGIQDRRQLADIMSIGSGHDARQRDATVVHQQVSLASIFFPDPSD